MTKLMHRPPGGRIWRVFPEQEHAKTGEFMEAIDETGSFMCKTEDLEITIIQTIGMKCADVPIGCKNPDKDMWKYYVPGTPELKPEGSLRHGIGHCTGSLVLGVNCGLSNIKHDTTDPLILSHVENMQHSMLNLYGVLKQFEEILHNLKEGI